MPTIRAFGGRSLLPSASFVLGDSKAEALERYREIRHGGVPLPRERGSLRASYTGTTLRSGHFRG